MKRTQEDILKQIIIENDELEEYREHLIHRILELQVQDQYTREELLKKSTDQLEDIYAYVK